MIKQLAYISILFISTWSFGQGKEFNYPAYDSVIDTFFNSFSIKDIPATSLIVFEKKPTGWHIAVVDHNNEPKKVRDEIIWDSKKGKFQKVNFKELEIIGENEEYINEYKNDWAHKFYIICPYYGYAGWDWDVIQKYKKEKIKVDTTLYAIGRAYSSYATNLLNNNTGLADTNVQFILPQGKNCLSRSQLKKYRYYRHKAIEYFKKVEELNPEFQTIVGPIGLKTSNEYLTSFLDVRVYQNEKEAMKEITSDLYADYYISSAKNYLLSCDSNAIIFTSGDSDTYPLLYIQSQYNFRTDITVINVGLLSSDRYANSLRQNNTGNQCVNLSLTSDEISETKRDFIVIEKQFDHSMELNEMIEFVKNKKHTQHYGDVEYYYIPANRFHFVRKNKSVEWKFDHQYFYKNQLIMFDILSSNNWNRPIYFVSLNNDYYLGLDDYLQLEGLAFKLTSNKKAEIDDKVGYINTAIMFENIMNNYDWTGMEKISSGEGIFETYYAYTFPLLAKALVQENKKDTACIVLDKCIEIFPDKIVFYNISMIAFIKLYFEIGEFDKGNEIAKKLVKNIKEDKAIYFKNTSKSPIDEKKKALGYLKTIAERYEQEDLILELEK